MSFYTEYYENGSIKSETDMVDGKKNGQQITYYPRSDGILIPSRIENFIDDVSNGIVTTYYELGAMKEVTTMRNGIISGVYYKYYEEGSIKTRKFYNKHGQLHGKEVKYSLPIKRRNYGQKGRIIKEVQWANGLRQGISRKYYPTGTIKKETLYDINGHKHGESKCYDEEGLVYKCTTWNHGMKL